MFGFPSVDRQTAAARFWVLGNGSRWQYAGTGMCVCATAMFSCSHASMQLGDATHASLSNLEKLLRCAGGESIETSGPQGAK